MRCEKPRRHPGDVRSDEMTIHPCFSRRRTGHPLDHASEDALSPPLIAVASYHSRNAESFQATTKLAVLQLQLERTSVEQAAERPT
jgi:hypothetical protein